MRLSSLSSLSSLLAWRPSRNDSGKTAPVKISRHFTSRLSELSKTWSRKRLKRATPRDSDSDCLSHCHCVCSHCRSADAACSQLPRSRSAGRTGRGASRERQHKTSCCSHQTGSHTVNNQAAGKKFPHDFVQSRCTRCNDIALDNITSCCSFSPADSANSACLQSCMSPVACTVTLSRDLATSTPRSGQVIACQCSVEEDSGNDSMLSESGNSPVERVLPDDSGVDNEGVTGHRPRADHDGDDDGDDDGVSAWRCNTQYVSSERRLASTCSPMLSRRRRHRPASRRAAPDNITPSSSSTITPSSSSGLPHAPAILEETASGTPSGGRHGAARAPHARRVSVCETRQHNDTAGRCMIVCVTLGGDEGGGKNLGVSIVGGRDGRGAGAMGIFVGRVFSGGLAHCTGSLQHDEILSVDGHSMFGVSHEEAVNKLRQYRRHKIKLHICRRIWSSPPCRVSGGGSVGHLETGIVLSGTACTAVTHKRRSDNQRHD